MCEPSHHEWNDASVDISDIVSSSKDQQSVASDRVSKIVFIGYDLSSDMIEAGLRASLVG